VHATSDIDIQGLQKLVQQPGWFNNLAAPFPEKIGS
jgi:hypothetical protein